MPANISKDEAVEILEKNYALKSLVRDFLTQEQVVIPDPRLPYPCVKGNFHETQDRFLDLHREELVRLVSALGFNLSTAPDRSYYTIAPDKFSKESLELKNLGFELINFNRDFLPSLKALPKDSYIYTSIDSVNVNSRLIGVNFEVKVRDYIELRKVLEELFWLEETALPFSDLIYKSKKGDETIYSMKLSFINEPLLKSIYPLVKDFI